MSPTFATLYIVFWIVAAGYGVGLVGHAGHLIAAAAPFAVLLIAVLRISGPTIEQIGWAAFTGWLGMTYAHTGAATEVVVFFGYVALAAQGLFRSPWLLGVGWLAHIAWDFVPRDLPGAYGDLPRACALFDGPIGLYLLACAASGRWRRLTPSAGSATRDGLASSP